MLQGIKNMSTENVVIACRECGTKNRVPEDRLKDNPVCGKCHAALAAENVYDGPVDITDQTFHREVIDFSGPVLVDCWAPWCGPCKSIAPVLDQLAKEYAGRIKIAKLNVDQNQVTASQYAVQSIPTMLLFKNGVRVNSLVGALPKNEIEKQIQTIIQG